MSFADDALCLLLLAFCTAEPLTRLAPLRSAALARPPHTVLSFNFSELPSGEPPQAAASTITVSTVVCGGVKSGHGKGGCGSLLGAATVDPGIQACSTTPPPTSIYCNGLPWFLPLVKEQERKILIAPSPRAALLFSIRLTFAVRRKESRGCNV